MSLDMNTHPKSLHHQDTDKNHWNQKHLCGYNDGDSVEEKREKPHRARQSVRTEGRSGTKETESEMLAFLPDMDLAVES